MTESEQKAEELFCKACVHKLFCCSDKRHSRCDKFRFYVKGLAEGRKESAEENEQLKEQNEKMQCCGNCKKRMLDYSENDICGISDERVYCDDKCSQWELKE